MKFRLLIGTCLLVNALNLQANERWFEIEMIIFERTENSGLKEYFPNQVVPIRLGPHIDLLTAPFYVPLPEEALCAATEMTDPNALATPVSADAMTVCEPKQAELNAQAQFNPFEQVSAEQTSDINHQFWPAQIPSRIFGESLHQSQPYLASEEAFQLNDLANRLNRQRQHNVLLHTVWRQAPVTERRAIPSRWFAGRNFTEQFDYWGQARQTAEIDPTLERSNQSDVFEQIDSHLQQINAGVSLANNANTVLVPAVTGQNNQNLPDQVWQLDGLFRLHLDHYLFVNTDFNLRHLHGEKLQAFNIKQTRRLISGEIHYLDHPKLGIILQIRRFDPSTAITDTTIRD